MNNYTILLEQFHIYQQQQTVTHEQFAEIIDYIRNEKQIKQSLIVRKKQEKHKLSARFAAKRQSSTSPTPKIAVSWNSWEEQCRLEEITNSILRKQNEELQKQLHKIQKSVKQMEQQLQVFNRKQNDIKQLKYSSRRELDDIYIEFKNQKIINARIQQKHYRLLQQLNMQKTNLQHQNRFLADQLDQMKYITKNYSKSGEMLVSYVDNGDLFKIQQIYTKRKVEEQLRCLYIIYELKANWDQFVADHLNYNQLISTINWKIFPVEHFHFLSKTQTLNYYLNKLNIKSFLSVVMIILDLYRSITKNINLLENRNNRFNLKLIQLKDEYRRLCEFMDIIKGDNLKRTTVLVKEGQMEINFLEGEVRSMCRFIFMAVLIQYKLFDRIAKIVCTMEGVIDIKNQPKINTISSSGNFRKKLSNMNKRGSVISEKQSSKNIGNQLLLNCPKNIPATSNGCIGLTITQKKSTFQTNKLILSKYQGTIGQYQAIINRNPRQVIFRWYEIIKNCSEALIFFQMLSLNDLFRIIFQPSDYNTKINELENEQECSKKVYQKVSKLLEALRDNFHETLGSLIQRSQQIQNKISLPSVQVINPPNQTRYVIESKEYYRRDNFKLLQKLEMLQLKRKGLYVPYRYGIDVEDEMINRTIIKQSPFNLERSNNFSCRKMRNTAPDTSNYISSYRERVNRADRKIRDLLKNADDLLIKRKISTSNALNQSRKISTSRMKGKFCAQSVLTK